MDCLTCGWYGCDSHSNAWIASPAGGMAMLFCRKGISVWIASPAGGKANRPNVKKAETRLWCGPVGQYGFSAFKMIVGPGGGDVILLARGQLKESVAEALDKPGSPKLTLIIPRHFVLGVAGSAFKEMEVDLDNFYPTPCLAPVVSNSEDAVAGDWGVPELEWKMPSSGALQAFLDALDASGFSSFSAAQVN